MDSYLTLVPRGLHHVVQAMIADALSSWEVTVQFVGERFLSAAGVDDESAFVQGMRAKLAQRQLRRKKRGSSVKSCPQQSETISSTCCVAVGTIHDDRFHNHRGEHFSFGYDEKNTCLWTVPGQLNGVVWMKVITNAPVRLIAHTLRCIGPAMALVHVWEDEALGESLSLQEATTKFQGLIDKSNISLSTSLHLWHKYAKQAWSLSDDDLTSLDEKLKGNSPLKYRLSCVRTESKKYPYPRHELVRSLANVLTGRLPAQGKKWTVDLKTYDLEIVLLVNANSLGIGLALNAYQRCGAKSFAQGVIPPDINSPYLSGQVLAGLVRLRPSTAQTLLYMASLRPGDVLLDPCAGIGTIPMETLFHKEPVVALGGDLILTEEGVGSLATNYGKLAQATRQKQQSIGSPPSNAASSAVNLLAWDASTLPIRSATVDAIISDLPFGQQCLSANKLENLLPLIISESARVLRPGSGRMVLLCGFYGPVLESLQRGNSNGDIWELPCAAVFPVNIGGLLAWVIKVSLVERSFSLHNGYARYSN